MNPTMKAIQWNAKEGRVNLVELEIPKLVQDTDVLVKVAFAGVCGTDIHIMQKEFPGGELLVMGHEFSGVVADVGKSVKHLKTGNRVAINPNSGCGKCNFCLKGQYHFCCTGSIYQGIGIFNNGGWAEYCLVPSEKVYAIPDELSLQHGALVEPFSCIERGYDNVGLIPSDAKILILGAGIIGILWASILHNRGLRDITISEPAEGRQKLARGLGIGLKVIAPIELIKPEVDYENDGYDLIVDCSGVPRAIEEAFTTLRKGGHLNLFGCCPQNTKVSFDPFIIYKRELKISGCFINPYTFSKSIITTTGMCKKYLAFDKIGVKLFDMNDYEKAFNELKSGSISKAMFKIDPCL